MEQEPALTQGIIFSDTVIREQGTGKLTFVGAFQYFNALQIPFVCPPFVVTAFLTNLRGKIENLPISVRIEETSSGHVAASSTGAIGSQKEIEPNEVCEIPFPIPPSIFPKAGIYKAIILVNNEAVGSRILTIKTVTAISQGE